MKLDNNALADFGGNINKGQNKNHPIENLDNDIRASILIGSRNPKKTDIALKDFKFTMLLGRGTFGKVYLAELAKLNKTYAIKAIRKDVLIEYN